MTLIRRRTVDGPAGVTHRESQGRIFHKPLRSTPAPCPTPLSRLNPEMEQQKFVVFLRERKQGAGHQNTPVQSICRSSVSMPDSCRKSVTAWRQAGNAP